MKPTPIALLTAVLLAACAADGPDPAEFAALEPSSRDRCDIARDGDFARSGVAELRRYLWHLAQSRAEEAAIDPRQVSLAVVHGPPEPGLVGVTAGEVACGLAGDPPYRITLYAQALVGRPLYTAYRTIAHEYQHIVQIRRDGLRCEPRNGTRELYEAEAQAVADQLVPSC